MSGHSHCTSGSFSEASGDECAVIDEEVRRGDALRIVAAVVVAHLLPPPGDAGSSLIVISLY